MKYLITYTLYSAILATYLTACNFKQNINVQLIDGTEIKCRAWRTSECGITAYSCGENNDDVYCLKQVSIWRDPKGA